MAKKYLCKNIKVVSYWNGYRPYYLHTNGVRELLSVAMPTRELAYAMGREQVKHMNETESEEKNSHDERRYNTNF